MKRLYIDERKADLYDDQFIGITKREFDITDIQNRAKTISTTIKLPWTPNNVRILGILFSSSSQQPYKEMTCLYIQNGIEIIRNGKIVITDVDHGESISVRLYDGIITIFEDIEKRDLVELDFSEYNHTWNVAGITGSFSNTDGYIYSIIQYGKYNAAQSEIEGQYLLPSIFLKTIINKIFTGYTIDGSIFSSAIYDKLIIPTVNDKLRNYGFIQEVNLNAIKDPYNGGAPKDTYQVVSNYNIVSQGSSNLRTDGIYVAPKDFNGVFRMYGQVTYFLEDGQSLYIEIRRHDSNYNYIETLVSHTVFASGGDIEVINDNFFQESSGNNINQGDQIGIGFRKSEDFPAADVILNNVHFEINVTDELVYGQTVDVGSLLPDDMTQKEFVKSFMNMFGLVPTLNVLTNTIKFESFDEIAAKEPIDMSEFVDLEQRPTYKPYIDYFAQSNNFIYKDDNEVETAIGNSTITSENANLPDSKEVVKLNFSASEETDGVAVIKRWNADGDKEFKANPRVLLFDLQDNPVKVFDDTPTEQTVNTDVPYSYFQDRNINGRHLGFDSLIANNFKVFYNILKNSRIITLSMLITEAYYYDKIDVTTPVYLNITPWGINGKFIVNKVDKYNPDGSTKFELIRI